MANERNNDSIRRGGPLEVAQDRRREIQGRELSLEEVAEAAEKAQQRERNSKAFYISREANTQERIGELEALLPKINAFLYGTSNSYPLPLDSDEQPRTKDELRELAKSIGDELRELKRIR